MATLNAYPGSPPFLTGPMNLMTSFTTTGDSTNIITRTGCDGDTIISPAAIIITSTIGATPSATLTFQGSVDGVNFFAIPYAVQATPRTFVTTAITITTAVTTTYVLQELVPWMFLKINVSANTNVTLTANAYV